VNQVKIPNQDNQNQTEKDKTQDVSQETNDVSGNKSDHEGQKLSLEDMKKAQLLEKAKELERLASKNYDLFIRSQAEIENLKKRFQKEKTDLIKFSNESLIKQLLAVVDNLEKAILAATDETSIAAVRQGIELTLKSLMDTLEKSGLKPVAAEGEPFDPNYHEAISEVADDNVKPGTVVRVLQKGYTLNDRLIRPAMVVVSKSSGQGSVPE